MSDTVDATATVQSGSSVVRNFFKTLFSDYGFLVILLAMVIISYLLEPAFLTPRNLMNVFRQMSITTIIAFGTTLVIIAGMIDLCTGSLAALTGVVGTMIYVATGSVVLGLLGGLAVGAVAGIINGFFITRFDLPPFIVTLAMMTGARGTVLLITGGKPVINIGDFTILGQGYLFGIPIPILIMFAVFLVMTVLLKKTKLGRYTYAIGGNQDAAVASGINVTRIKIVIFIIAGLCTGLAGVLLMSRINSGQPSAGLMYELDAITAVVVGGTSLSGGGGTMLGTLVGGLIVAILQNILNLTNVSPYWQQILKGAVIVLAVVMDQITKAKKKGK
ncbi:MAG: ABC transporter permease [Desulfopila sp.]